MKFDKIEPKKNWDKQKVYRQISIVKRDIAQLNRELNAYQGKLHVIILEKTANMRRVKNKWKYLRQLQSQLVEKKEIVV